MDILFDISIIILLFLATLSYIFLMHLEIQQKKELYKKELDKLELELAILRKNFSDLCKK